jgi:regulator of sirC expression with transglutaminase-like and TPR domain
MMLNDGALGLVRDFAASEDATIMDAALTVARCLDATLDALAVEAALTELVGRYDGRNQPWEFLKGAGFAGSGEVAVPEGSRIDRVLAGGTGLPITLGALLVHVAQTAGLSAWGVNFPGRFLVRVGQTLVDPFAMTARSEAECLAQLPEDADTDDAFAPADPGAVLLRMFNNLKYFHAGQGSFHRALDMLDCQLQVLPEDARLHFEQGELWLRLGSVDSARRAFQTAASHASRTGSGLEPLIRQRLEDLQGKSDTLH